MSESTIDRATPVRKRGPSEMEARSKDMRPLRRLLPFILKYPVRLALTGVFLLVATIASLAIPVALVGVID